MVGEERDWSRNDDFRVDLTRPPAPAPGELDYASTITAPTEWVPYVYTDSELTAQAGQGGLSIASLVFGLLGLLIAVFGVWGAALSLAAVVLAVMARVTERRASTAWAYGLWTGLAGLVLAVGWVLIVTQVLTVVPG
ncbi:hypothetical protein E3N86_10215 [Cryobacterium sp. Hz7]|uniref:DUF4190 domain-containing protein n=1 Tax=Cryobacterium sp. Hz7 TaxID=1259166 RepID=UPI00106B7AD2|nr:DUF4190 domain-containing protein [Cryobacterium sp. Hz7]TFB59901.1 hypothetical protein E3N86_10215 [Cryobacterium sp. Hz7]